MFSILTFVLLINYAVGSPSESNGRVIHIGEMNLHLSLQDDSAARRSNQDRKRRFNEDVEVQRQIAEELEKLEQSQARLEPADIVPYDGMLNYPYMAAVLVHGRLWCAGAIVDVNWVLTAAHCLNYVLQVSPLQNLATKVQVRVGSPLPYEGGTLVGVTGAIRHPKFEEEPVPHADIALLKLEKNLIFGKYVNVIQIYEGVKQPFAQSFVVVSGWGLTTTGGYEEESLSSHILTARLKVRTQHYCIDAHQHVNGFMFSEDFFCASLRNGTRDACMFDAGAPAVQQNRLMGVMSFGPERCGHETQPAVFIKAFFFRDFVKATITSYKSTNDLIAAMQSIDPPVTRKVVTVSNDLVNNPYVIYNTADQFTMPDAKHD